MQIDAEIAGVLSPRCDANPRRMWFCRSLPHLVRHREQYSRHAREIARGHRQFELLINPSESSENGLPNPSDRLAPTEVFLDAFANDLADPIAIMPRRPAVDGAAATTSVILGHVRRDLALATGRDEVGGVVGLVGANRLGMGAGNTVEHADRRFAFAGAIGMRDDRADHEPRAVLHQYMPLVGKDRGRVVALPVQARLRIGRAGVGVIAARLAFPIRLRVAPAAIGRLVVRAIFRAKALLAGPGLNQRAVDREMLLRKQPLPVGLAHHFGEEGFNDLVLEQAIPVLREDGMVPDRIFQRQPDEPAEQEVVAHLFHQLPLGADRVEHLQEQCAHQFLGGNRVASPLRVDRIEQTVEAPQRFIDQRPDAPQRMIRRNKIIQLRHREKTLLHPVRSAHPAHPVSTIMNTIYRTSTPQTPLTRDQISTAC